MATTNSINSNFYQIANADTNGNVVGITTGNVVATNTVSAATVAANIVGANTVTANGITTNTLTVANISGLYIPGGLPGQVLTTDGNGNLVWGVGGGSISGNGIQPQIEWTATGGNATFTDANLATFQGNANYAAVYLNGVLLPTSEYTITGNTLTFTNNVPPLVAGDLVTVGPAGAAATGTVTSIATTQVDPSSLGFTLTGGNITTAGTVTLNVPNAVSLRTALGIANLANYPALPTPPNANVYLNGAGAWTPVGGTGAGGAYLMASGGNLIPNVYPANTALVFDTVHISSGNILYNTTTGELSLPVGGVYRLTATVQSTVTPQQWGATGDITFIWQYFTSNIPVYPHTETIADSYTNGAIHVGTQATNEIIVSTTGAAGNTLLKVATVYSMNAHFVDVNFVRLIAQQIA